MLCSRVTSNTYGSSKHTLTGNFAVPEINHSTSPARQRPQLYQRSVMNLNPITVITEGVSRVTAFTAKSPLTPCPQSGELTSNLPAGLIAPTSLKRCRLTISKIFYFCNVNSRSYLKIPSRLFLGVSQKTSGVAAQEHV